MFYVSLALSDTMFPDSQRSIMAKRTSLTPEKVKEWLDIWGDEVQSALNPSHASTIEAIKRRFGIKLPVSSTAPKIVLEEGDYLLVLQAQFNRRLAEGERYTQEEVNAAEFKFHLWTW